MIDDYLKYNIDYFEDIRNKWAQDILPTYSMLLLLDVVFGIIIVYLIITNPWTGNLPTSYVHRLSPGKVQYGWHLFPIGWSSPTTNR